MSSRPRRAAAQAADVARQAVRAGSAGAGGKAVPATNGSNPGQDAAAGGGSTAMGTEATLAAASKKSKRDSAVAAVGLPPDGQNEAGKPAKKARKSTKPSNGSSAVSATIAPGPVASRNAGDIAGPPAGSAFHSAPSLLPPTLTFSLDTAIAHLAAADARFGRMFAHVPIKPFSPPLEAIDPFRTLVTSIIGQQVSWMAARAINNRFRALFGYGAGAVKVEDALNSNDNGEAGEAKGSDNEEDGGFPSPTEVLGKDAMTLKGVGLSMRKAEYVLSLAEHFQSGALSTHLLAAGTDEEISKALIAVRGIGQWTVDMFLMFSLRRPDVLPVGDLGVQKGLLRWFLAAHGALPQSNKGKAKGKGKEEKGGKAAEAARKKYAPQPQPQTQTPIKSSCDGAAAFQVKQEQLEEGLVRMSPPTPTPEREVRHPNRGELDTVISTPPPDRQFGLGPGSDAGAGKAGKVQMQLPPTPLTPGQGDVDSPLGFGSASGGSGGATVAIGALHTLVTPSNIGNERSAAAALPRLPPTPLSPGPSRVTLSSAQGTQKGSGKAQGKGKGMGKEAEVVPQETLEIPSSALPPPPPPSGDQLLHPTTGLEGAAPWNAHDAAPLEGGLNIEVLRSRLSGKKVKGGAYLTAEEMDRMTEHWKPFRSLGVYYMWPAGEEF